MASGAALAKSPVAPEAGQSGWATVQKLVQTFQSPAGAGDAHCAILADNLIDYRQIAMRSLGTADWQSLTVVQKQDLTETIAALVQNRYYPRWRKIFGKGEVTYVGEEKRNGDVVVTTNLRLGQEEESLTWLLTAPQPRVISLAVNHNDLLTKLAQRIHAHQSKGGYRAMITWLKSKGKSDIADGETQSGKAEAMAPLKTSSRSIDLID